MHTARQYDANKVRLSLPVEVHFPPSETFLTFQICFALSHNFRAASNSTILSAMTVFLTPASRVHLHRHILVLMGLVLLASLPATAFRAASWPAASQRSPVALQAFSTWYNEYNPTARAIVYNE
jgi:hypothetical protein